MKKSKKKNAGWCGPPRAPGVVVEWKTQVMDEQKTRVMDERKTRAVDK